MARVLTIFSILIALATAFLGWKTKDQVTQLREGYQEAKGVQRSAEGRIRAIEKDRDEAKGKLDATEASLKKAQEELTGARTELQNMKTDYDKAKADVDDKAQQLAKMNAILNKDPNTTTETAISPERIKELTDARARLETELAEAKQVQETLRQKADEAEGKLASRDQTIQSYRGPIMQRGLSGKVLAYNPGWNFVVLNIGDKAGVRNGVQLVVTRGGSMVGKVRVTTVEPSTSIADVLPGTLAKGQSVQPGDIVLFEGR
jgi:SMC interacting uncharacterized protein involved in chromosome segregation